MRKGDMAGLGLLQKNYGLVGVRVTGGRRKLVMVNATGTADTVATVPLGQQTVYLKATTDFRDRISTSRTPPTRPLGCRPGGARYGKLPDWSSTSLPYSP